MFARTLLKYAAPFQIPGATGEAWLIYAHQKSALVEGRLVCPLVEPLLNDQSAGSYTYVMLGRVTEPEAVPSHAVDLRPTLMEFACTQLLAGKPRLADLKFIARLYRQQLCFPKRWRSLHLLRTWMLARHFSVKFSALADACRSAHLTVYYNAAMLGAVSAFRQRAKPVWDVQHGYLGPSHDAYNNVAAFAIDTTLKPTGFVVWDDDFGRYVESTLGAHWRSTDYAHLKMFLRLVPPRARDRTQVLFTLQWATPLPASVVQAATAPDGSIDWVFRMHPAEKSDRADLLPLHGAPNVRIVDSRDPLALAIASADLHVTVNSSVVHEAAIIGVPSIYFDPVCRERFEREAARQLAFFTDDAGFGSLLGRLAARTLQ